MSNLFAYDAEGNPLTDVQIFDDRGRPVRTDASTTAPGQWFFPETEEPWSFVSRADADGRSGGTCTRCKGAPMSEFDVRRRRRRTQLTVDGHADDPAAPVRQGARPGRTPADVARSAAPTAPATPDATRPRTP